MFYFNYFFIKNDNLKNYSFSSIKKKKIGIYYSIYSKYDDSLFFDEDNVSINTIFVSFFDKIYYYFFSPFLQEITLSFHNKKMMF